MIQDPLREEEIGIKTLEQRVQRTRTARSFSIGVPRESSADELRVSLAPSGVAVLVANGHKVIIERNAGEDARFTDLEYSNAGAEIVGSAHEVYNKSEVISKIAIPTEKEIDFLQPNQTLISALHLGSTSHTFFHNLLKKKINALGFEFIQSVEGIFPIVRMMHEITGTMAIQIAAHYLESLNRGQGKLLGGISGIPPAKVTILGAGTVAEYAARIALGYGAQVIVMDNDLLKLKSIENTLDRRVFTAMANETYLSEILPQSDVLIGAVNVDGDRSPCLVTEEMVSRMKSGAVIVDTMIDQGGCIATSKCTTHSNPVYIKEDVLHYCVPNIPSQVANSASYALNNVIVPFLLALGDAGSLHEAIWDVHDIRTGIYTYKGHIAKKSIGKMLGLPYRDVELLAASLDS